MELPGVHWVQQWIVTILLFAILKKGYNLTGQLRGFQLQQKKLAEMITEITKAQLLVLAARQF